MTFGDELLPLEQCADRLDGWNEVLAPEQESDHAQREIAHLSERLGQMTAERDRLAARLTSTPITSALRRVTSSDRVPDDLFIRTIRRR